MTGRQAEPVSPAAPSAYQASGASPMPVPSGQMYGSALPSTVAPGYPGAVAAPGADPVTGLRLSGWGRRAGAYLLDLVIILLSLIPTLIWVGVSTDPVTDEPSDAALTVFVIQIFFGPSIYNWIFLGARGATLGKMAVDIRVVRSDTGGPIGFARALGRVASVFLLGLLSFPLLLSYLWPLWDTRNQSLHDKMASTIVVAE